MPIRNFFSALMLIVGTMTSCQSFVLPTHAPAFQRAAPLFDTEVPDPEYSPESATTGMPETEMESDSGFIGLDEDFVPFPSRDLDAPEVVQICMDALKNNGKPFANAGLEACFNFSSDRCRAAQGGSLEAFIQYAGNPVFSSMVDALNWSVLSTGPVIQGTKTRGAMRTVLVNVQPQKGEARRFLWTLQQERRPPRQECWLVWECLFVENAYELTL